MAAFLPVAREHCVGVEIAPVRMAEGLNAEWVVGFSGNWIMCGQAEVLHADGELGTRLGLLKAPSSDTEPPSGCD
jgi:hypothetical protein